MLSRRCRLRTGRLFSWLITALLFLACSGDDSDSDSISVTSGGVVELSSVVNQSMTVTFQAPGDWSATCSADWVVFSPKAGHAGSNSITVTTSKTNRTKNSRSGQLVITSGSVRKPVTLIQSSLYAIFDQKEYMVEADGGVLSLAFKTNVESDKLMVRYTQQDWIHWENEARQTRAEWSGKTHNLQVDRNTTADGRVALFVLSMPSRDGEWVGLDTAYVYQSAVVTDYESSDYSSDGVVSLLQKSTEGRGIPVILMGDGFSDRDIADSTYLTVMKKTMENLFSEEPVRSLRSYFDVYVVTAVSRHGNVGKDCTTVFSTVPSVSGSDIDFDDQAVLEYAQRVKDIDVTNALVVVILNSRVHNGMTMMLSDKDTGKPIQYAVALCATIDGLESDVFRQVLTHEAVGHGFAKLADEYGYDAKGAPSADIVSMLKQLHQYGWMRNVDVTDDKDEVLWHEFIGDSRFDNEQIDIYEGAYTYAFSVYRPTEESMMNHNKSPFNAPSRKAIYDRVMALGKGRAESTHDEFADFDMQHKPAQWNYSTRGPVWSPSRRLASPTVKRVKWDAISRGSRATE